jgi:hypothetical protein
MFAAYACVGENVIPGRCDSIEPGIHGAVEMLGEMDSGPSPAG